MGFPLDQYEHLMLAILCWSYFHDLDFVSWFQWRNRAASDTAGSKREVHGVGEIIIPTHRLFFRTIGIHNNFHVDPLFTFFIFGATSHMHPPFVDNNWVSAKSSLVFDCVTK